MIYSHEVKTMCPVAIGANHGPAPIPEEAKWVKVADIPKEYVGAEKTPLALSSSQGDEWCCARYDALLWCRLWA